MVIQIARRVFRRFLPRRTHPLLDRAVEPFADDAANALRYREAIGDAREAFLEARFEEGRRWREVMRHYAGEARRVLDVGGGNGAVELAFAPWTTVVSVEALWNDVARVLGVRRVIADAGALPFRDGAFDALLLLDTVEHLRDRERSADEIARVARPGAALLVTTPPRLRFAFRGDPHFGIRGLVLLPPALQRRVAARAGFSGEQNFVDRIYTSVPQLARILRGFRVADVLSRSRAPRRWFWDAVVFRRK